MIEHDLTRERVARMVDHTLLAPEATRADAEATVLQAAELGVFAVCLSPSMLPIAPGDQQRLAVVAGFPSGKHHALVKAAEARMAVDAGAQEVDMVIDLGLLKSGRDRDLVREIRAVRGEVSLLKVIIESAALSDDEIVIACEAAAEAGADFVVWDFLNIPSERHRARIGEMLARIGSYPPSYYRDLYGTQPLPDASYRANRDRELLARCDALFQAVGLFLGDHTNGCPHGKLVIQPVGRSPLEIDITVA